MSESGVEERQLSKSKYCYGLQCPRLLYKSVKMPRDMPEPDAGTQLILDQGHEVGAAARERFPGAY